MKGKGQSVPSASSVSNRDIIHRLNFIYQASAYLSSIPVSHNATAAGQTARTETHKKKRNNKRKPTKTTLNTGDLAQAYIKMMKTVGQKSTVKIDPGVKRTLCKSCNTVLIPGATVSVRVKKSPTHQHVTVYTCFKCAASRRIPAPPTLDLVNSSPSQVVPTMSATCLGASLGSLGGTPMNVDHEETSQGKRHSQQRLGKPRVPPLFARDVGHLVFRGNDPVVKEEGRGHGIYII